MGQRKGQSDISINKVGKLCYQVRGPFTIIKSTGRGSYMVCRFGKLTSPPLKYHRSRIKTGFFRNLFSFDPCQEFIYPCRFVARHQWKHLSIFCAEYDFVPSILSSYAINRYLKSNHVQFSNVLLLSNRALRKEIDCYNNIIDNVSINYFHVFRNKLEQKNSNFLP